LSSLHIESRDLSTGPSNIQEGGKEIEGYRNGEAGRGWDHHERKFNSQARVARDYKGTIEIALPCDADRLADA
jgi:hypothetical protein